MYLFVIHDDAFGSVTSQFANEEEGKAWAFALLESPNAYYGEMFVNPRQLGNGWTVWSATGKLLGNDGNEFPRTDSVRTLRTRDIRPRDSLAREAEVLWRLTH